MENKKYNLKKIIIIVCIPLFFFQSFRIFPDEPVSDYNTYYLYPLAFGIEYQNLIPISPYVDDYEFILFDVSGVLEMPLKSIPQLKFLGRGGAVFTIGNNQATGSEFPDNKFDQTSFYCGAGAGYSHRFSRLLEAGLEITGGVDFTIFPYLLPGENSQGAYTFYTDIKMPLTINPIYNLSIDLQPGIRYRVSLGPLHYFDGFLFSIGGTINFRLGEDPDIKGIMQSIHFNRISLSTLFAGMQSYYSRNPAGTISITNVEKYSLHDIKVSFFQAGYMDSPTPAGTIAELKPGQTVEIPLFVSFNAEIFNTEGITPLTGEVAVTYLSKGKPGRQIESIVYDLYDKTALTWDDDRKIGAYITPSDSVLKNFTSFILQAGKENLLISYNNPLQSAMLIYSALTEIGCLYKADPVLPFSSAQKNTGMIDTINLPRDTLRRITGDCDDLTVLYLSALETIGIESGFITIPGHIYPVVNTGIPARHYRKVHPERSMTIIVNGTVWVPVEVTMIGRGSFLKAWEAGAQEWLSREENPENRKFYITRDIQTLYRPVGLKKTDMDFSSGNSGNIAGKFKENLLLLSDIIIRDFVLTAEENKQKSDYNKLGIIYANFDKTGKAEEAFRTAIEIDPEYSLAIINLGNLFFQTGRYDDTLSQYFLALNSYNEKDRLASPTYLKLLLKISVVYYQLEQYNKAREYYVTAQKISPDETAQYAYLKNMEQGETRSTELPGYYLVLQYMEEE
ncbi:MAG: hypothetical protein JXB88_09415 [Spirochaetales bacterium]|nr:hypothetical protein [Spirochaetales bacterium]